MVAATVAARISKAFGTPWRIAFALGCFTGLVLIGLAALVSGVPKDQLAAALALMMGPLVAIITAYIAFQQLRTNQQKLNFDFYDRRLAIYNHVRDLLRKIGSDANIDPPEVIKFWHAVAEADFLFDRGIRAYINEIYTKAMTLNSVTYAHNQAAAAGAKDFDYKAATTKRMELVEWFMGQPEAAVECFRAYMSTSAP
jgi:hypothetical protein